MHYMDFITALVLGLVQGITEFLPLSSSGHLIIVREIFGFGSENDLAFDAVLYLSTTAAIGFYFRGYIWVLVQTLIRKLGRLPVNQKDLILLHALFLGTIPAVVLGLVLEPLITKNLYSSVSVVAVSLLLSAFFFMYAEWRYYTKTPQGILTPRNGFLVGCFQVLAIIPGFSRVGATLAGGMLLGLTRIESARFSFLMSMPISFGLGIKKLLELIIQGEEVPLFYISVSALVSFTLALLTIHFFIDFIRRHTLWPFIWYNIVLSVLLGYLLFYV